MKLAVQIKLLPDKTQAQALLGTIPRGFTNKPADCRWCGKALPLPRNSCMAFHPECRPKALYQRRKARPGFAEATKNRSKQRWASEEQREQFRSASRRRMNELRRQIIAHYGGKCACCGEDRFEFLAIDHTDGDGNSHRREIGYGGKICRWLLKNNFPEGFRILCHNCNMAHGMYGYCPHSAHADHNAAMNLRAIGRAVALQPYAATS